MCEALRPTVEVIGGPQAGPVVGILGGVHGDEYEGVLAAALLRREIGAELACGQVRIAAPAHPAAWASRTRHSPDDGADLARVFPGRADGSPTQRIAHLLTEQVIRGADLLIDLHSAGSGFAMPFLCGFHGGDDRRARESRRIAEAFAAHFTWEHEGVPAAGRSVSTAFDLGVPAIYVETHGGLSVRAQDLLGYLDGVRRVLHALGMVADAPPASFQPIHVRGDGNTDAGILAPASGFLVAHHEVGAFVHGNEVIAAITQPDGTGSIQVLAPHDGFLMLLRRDARVARGDTVCIVATPEGS